MQRQFSENTCSEDDFRQPRPQCFSLKKLREKPWGRGWISDLEFSEPLVPKISCLPASRRNFEHVKMV